MFEGGEREAEASRSGRQSGGLSAGVLLDAAEVFGERDKRRVDSPAQGQLVKGLLGLDRRRLQPLQAGIRDVVGLVDVAGDIPGRVAAAAGGRTQLSFDHR